MHNKYYDLYALRQLTESIYCMRQEMGRLDCNSEEHKKMTELYEILWKERDALESKIIEMCNKSSDNKSDNGEDCWII